MVDSIVPKNIKSLIPYPPGKPLSELERELGVTRAIKLASNENALGPSPRALAAIQEGRQRGALCAVTNTADTGPHRPSPQPSAGGTTVPTPHGAQSVMFLAPGSARKVPGGHGVISNKATSVGCSAFRYI